MYMFMVMSMSMAMSMKVFMHKLDRSPFILGECIKYFFFLNQSPISTLHRHPIRF